MPEFPWIIGGNYPTVRPDKTVVPKDPRDWAKEKFGGVHFDAVPLRRKGQWVKVEEGIYLLSWRWKKPEAEEWERIYWTPLYIPHPMVLKLEEYEKGEQHAMVWRLASKQHEAWKEKAPPKLFHSVRIYTEFLDRPMVRAGGIVIGTVAAGLTITKLLEWW